MSGSVVCTLISVDPREFGRIDVDLQWFTGVSYGILRFLGRSTRDGFEDWICQYTIFYVKKTTTFGTSNSYLITCSYLSVLFKNIDLYLKTLLSLDFVHRNRNCDPSPSPTFSEFLSPSPYTSRESSEPLLHYLSLLLRLSPTFFPQLFKLF